MLPRCTFRLPVHRRRESRHSSQVPRILPGSIRSFVVAILVCPELSPCVFEKLRTEKSLEIQENLGPETEGACLSCGHQEYRPDIALGKGPENALPREQSQTRHYLRSISRGPLLRSPPGRQKDHFFNVVHKQMPNHYDQLQSIYANNHVYGHPIFDRLPVNVMIQGRKICQQVGISDRSIRHMPPEEPTANVQVLNRLLDFIFYQSLTLGKPKRLWKPYYDLAVKIDKGVPDLASLRQQGTLGETLGISVAMVADLEAILDTDTFGGLTKTITQIDNFTTVI